MEETDQGGNEFNLSFWFKFEEDPANFDGNSKMTLVELSGMINGENHTNHLFLENKTLFFLSE